MSTEGGRDDEVCPKQTILKKHNFFHNFIYNGNELVEYEIG